jgi:HSP20 family molecular chaperone IbpA
MKVTKNKNGSKIYEIDAPGFNKDDVKVRLDGNKLHLNGSKKKKTIDETIILSDKISNLKLIVENDIIKIIEDGS